METGQVSLQGEGGPAPTRHRFSIVIPTYNRASTIGTTLRSLAQQTFTDFETVVVDDGSDDDTESIVESCRLDPLVYIKQANQGVAAARNRGAAAACGEYVLFIDTGDELRSHALEVLDRTIGSLPIDFVSFGVEFARDGTVFRRVLPVAKSQPQGNTPARFRAGLFAARREFFLMHGGYDHRLRFSEAWDLGVRFGPLFASKRASLKVVDEVLGRNNVPATVGESFAYTDENRLRSAELLLSKHGEVFEHHPRVHRTYLRLAGVASARLGDRSKARRYFYRAWRVQPRAVDELLRYGVAWIPPLARRTWPKRA